MEKIQFNSDLLFSVEKPFLKTYIEEFFLKKLGNKNSINIAIEENEIEPTNYKTGWNIGSSMMNLYINDSFLENHFNNNSESWYDFQAKFLEFIKPLTKFSKINELVDFKSNRPFSIFSTFYKTKDNYTLQFLFELSDNENIYWKALEEALKTINLYNSPENNDLKRAIKESYSPNKELKYLVYKEDKWFVINPLLEIGKEINDRYRENKDFRIKKPHIILNRDDFTKYLVFDSNWVLVFDNLETLMIQPNDVSLYSNISDTNLKKAQEFYNEKILPRHQIWYGAFPSIEIQIEYYNYFELIITSLIFAYTALEAFANICIPNDYEFLVDKNGVKTIYSKEAIERKYSLREKFKVILKDIMSTSDPTKENWWNDFVILENLRNEIIHTKQSKSEVRYSKLLQKNIFPLIESHKRIIKFYGEFIKRNKKELLEEYPYNFDYDDFLPGLMTNENYVKSYRSIRNMDVAENHEEE